MEAFFAWVEKLVAIVVKMLQQTKAWFEDNEKFTEAANEWTTKA